MAAKNTIMLELKVDDKGSVKIKKFSTNVNAAFKKITKSSSTMSNNIKTASTKTGLSFEKIKIAANALKTVFTVGLTAASAGVTAAFAGIIKTGMDFESQMATVKGVTRATNEEFEMLSDAAKLMGETTEWSATQSAEALKYMGMAGYTAAESIKALPTVLNLATAGGLDLGRAADIVTDSLSGMGMGIDQLTRFSDVLVGTITRTNTNIELMGESLKYAAPIASQLGYDIESLSAMLGILANSGIKASNSGTDLRMAMIKNIEAAQKLGTSEKDLIGTLKAAKEAHWGITEITKYYGVEASKTVLVLMRQTDEYEKLKEQLHNVKGETEALAKIKLDTLEADFKLLKSAIEGIGIAAYENLKGELRKAVQELTEYVSRHQDDLVDFVKNMIEYITEHEDDFENFAKNIIEIGEDLLTVSKNIGSLLKNTLSGWNTLPTTVQELGLVAALVGGTKGRIAILAVVEALGLIQESINKAYDVGKSQIEILEKKLVEVKERIKSLKETLNNSSDAWLNFWKGKGYSDKLRGDLKDLDIEMKLIEKTIERLRKKKRKRFQKNGRRNKKNYRYEERII